MPVNGDSVIFNDRSEATFQGESTNNLSNLQLNSILFEATGNAVPAIYGNNITLSGGVSENVSFWGAELLLPITLSASQTFESLTDGRLTVSNVNVGTRSLTLDTRLNGSRININGRLSGSGSIDITGPGQVTFASSQTNTFSGPVRLSNGGRLTLGSQNAAGGIPSIAGDLIIGDGMTPSDVSIAEDHQVNGDVVLNSRSRVTLSGSTDFLPSFTLIDANVLIFSGGLLGLTGPVMVGGTSNSVIRGAVTLDSASRTFTVSNNVELRLDGVISGFNLSISRPGIIKGGDGTLLLLSNNTFGGNVSINAGRVIATEPRSLGAPTTEIAGITVGATSVGQGGELLLSTVSVTNELLTVGTTQGGLSTTGTCAWVGQIVVTTNAPFNISNATFTVNGAVTGAGAIVKRGSGTLTLTGTSANSFSGVAQHNAGLLILDKTPGVTAIAGELLIGDFVGGANADVVRVQQAEQIADTSRLNLAPTGQLDLNAPETVGAISGSGQIRLDGGDLTFGGNGTDETLIASVVGTFGLTKIGAGIQTLSGLNTYTGPTRVLAGTLRVNGVQLQSTINVIGAALEGIGMVGHITCNGRIAPGSGASDSSVLTCSNLTFQAGGSLAINIGGPNPGTGHDQLLVRGAVQLANAALMPTLDNGFLPDSGDSFVILSNDGADAIGGTFFGLPNNSFVSAGPGLRFQVRYNGGDGNDVILIFTNETVVAKPVLLSAGNGNPRLDPNECALLGGSVSNQTAQAHANVSVEFLPLSGGLNISNPRFSFPTIAPASAASIPPVTVLSIANNVVCGSTLRIAMVLRQGSTTISSATLAFIVGSGGAGGCADGGGVCTYCPDIVVNGTLLPGDLVQLGTLSESAAASTCAAGDACPGINAGGARLVDALTFQNGPRSACITVRLDNVCNVANSDLFATAYTGAYDPSNLCAKFVAGIGGPLSEGKTGEISFRAGANEVFVITVNEFKTGLSCTDYRLTVSGGDCRPRLGIENIAGPNVRVSWPNSGAGWHPQAANILNAWSDLNIAPSNSTGNYFIDVNGGLNSRYFRLREP
ncbi:MAG TPA: autotransporter-associated beta strand repeat-containing protein [Verrucomicrobiae bacterium]|nr:autotransporter-associated beta strand repeat-containing protein [Verrucomicrobiae bacterium]